MYLIRFLGFKSISYFKSSKRLYLACVKSLPYPSLPLFEISHLYEDFSIPLRAPLASGSVFGGKVHSIIPYVETMNIENLFPLLLMWYFQLQAEFRNCSGQGLIKTLFWAAVHKLMSAIFLLEYF